MDLKTLSPSPGSTHRIKRVGRGIGSGHGKTSGRGHKGRLSRSGGNTPPGYEGGQMPLQRRLPKRGFRRLPATQRAREEYAVLNLSRLAQFQAGSEIDPAVLVSKGMVGAGRKVKILGEGDLAVNLVVRAHAFSKRASEKIVAAGGTVEKL